MAVCAGRKTVRVVLQFVYCWLLAEQAESRVVPLTGSWPALQTQPASHESNEYQGPALLLILLADTGEQSGVSDNENKTFLVALSK
jgi:hypothetical protein